MTTEAATRPRTGLFHDSVRQYKRHLIRVTLAQTHGNRTQAARRLGLQRTYLLRLLRELPVLDIPPTGGTR